MRCAYSARAAATAATGSCASRVARGRLIVRTDCDDQVDGARLPRRQRHHRTASVADYLPIPLRGNQIEYDRVRPWRSVNCRPSACNVGTDVLRGCAKPHSVTESSVPQADNSHATLSSLALCRQTAPRPHAARKSASSRSRWTADQQHPLAPPGTAPPPFRGRQQLAVDAAFQVEIRADIRRRPQSLQARDIRIINADGQHAIGDAHVLGTLDNLLTIHVEQRDRIHRLAGRCMQSSEGASVNNAAECQTARVAA